MNDDDDDDDNDDDDDDFDDNGDGNDDDNDSIPPYAWGRHVHLFVHFVFLFRAFNCCSLFPHDVSFKFVISFSVPYVYLKPSSQDIAHFALSLNCIQSSLVKIHCPLRLIEIDNATAQERNPHSP